MERRRNPDDVNKEELRNLEEVNLACGKCRVLEITSRAIIFMKESFFGMNEIDQESNYKKDKKKSDLKRDLLSVLHFCPLKIYKNMYKKSMGDPILFLLLDSGAVNNL